MTDEEQKQTTEEEVNKEVIEGKDSLMEDLFPGGFGNFKLSF